jgi:hypothetical protein
MTTKKERIPLGMTMKERKARFSVGLSAWEDE